YGRLGDIEEARDVLVGVASNDTLQYGDLPGGQLLRRLGLLRRRQMEFVVERKRRPLIDLWLELERPQACVDKDQPFIDHGLKRADESGGTNRTEQRCVRSVIKRARERFRMALIGDGHDKGQWKLIANPAADGRLISDNEEHRSVAGDLIKIIQFDRATVR